MERKNQLEITQVFVILVSIRNSSDVFHSFSFAVASLLLKSISNALPSV